ncbi:frataxin [Artemisia annua]|uniref:Frataxin n=1 Tax=Artemisia annua TaxID=35608 RepID=A0A2U1P989_ARTAN|nr:frataxin [Artemisia annua]
MAAASKVLIRRLSRSLNSINSSRFLSSSSSTILHQHTKLNHSILYNDINKTTRAISTKHFSSQFEGPAAIDYSALLEEDEFHKLADATIHDLLEKIEEYGDSVDIDGFDIDYGNQVLTVKFGSLGTYVLNKQTPNRQIWMSSPVRYKLPAKTFSIYLGLGYIG